MSARVVRAFAPATVANVGSGFDVLGFAIEGLGDVVEARRRDEPGVVVTNVTGDDGTLPRDADRNTAAVAAARLLALTDPGFGVELVVEKGMPLASGLGSSAASGVAGAVATSALLDEAVPLDMLLRCAVEGERVACGAAHADNVAPSLHGGLVLVRGGGTTRVDPLPVPRDLWCALVHPHLRIPTGEAREVLPEQVGRDVAVAQAANLAALVAGLLRADWDLVASGLVDAIAEPHRAGRVPGFEAVRAAAREAGALGGGLSGSGPSMFALCRGRDAAERVVDAMGRAAANGSGVEVDRLVSPVGARAARVLEGET